MVKLESGREVEIKEPNRKQGLKLKIASASGYEGLDVFWDAAKLGLGCTDKTLEEYNDEEIIQIAGLVFEKISLSDTQKKS